MDLQAARQRLSDESWEQRLQGAVYLGENGSLDDLQILRRALAAEDVLWVQTALEDAIHNLGRGAAKRSQRRAARAERPAVPTAEGADAASASRLIHVLELPLGEARLAAQREITTYEASDTWKALERIRALLDGFERLSRAASVTSNEQIAIAPFLLDLVSRESANLGLEPGSTYAAGFSLTTDGRDDAVVVGDRGLLELVLSNAIRNALECVMEVPSERRTLSARCRGERRGNSCKCPSPRHPIAQV